MLTILEFGNLKGVLILVPFGNTIMDCWSLYPNAARHSHFAASLHQENKEIFRCANFWSFPTLPLWLFLPLHLVPPILLPLHSRPLPPWAPAPRLLWVRVNNLGGWDLGGLANRPVRILPQNRYWRLHIILTFRFSHFPFPFPFLFLFNFTFTFHSYSFFFPLHLGTAKRSKPPIAGKKKREMSWRRRRRKRRRRRTGRQKYFYHLLS